MISEDMGTNYLRPAAFLTITGCSAGTVFGVLNAASGGTMQKTAAYGALAFGCAAATVSAATAWFDPSSKDAKSYLKNASNHFFYVIPTITTTIASGIFNAAVEGASKAIGDVVYDKVKKSFS